MPLLLLSSNVMYNGWHHPMCFIPLHMNHFKNILSIHMSLMMDIYCIFYQCCRYIFVLNLLPTILHFFGPFNTFVKDTVLRQVLFLDLVTIKIY